MLVNRLSKIPLYIEAHSLSLLPSLGEHLMAVIHHDLLLPSQPPSGDLYLAHTFSLPSFPLICNPLVTKTVHLHQPLTTFFWLSCVSFQVFQSEIDRKFLVCPC